MISAMTTSMILLLILLATSVWTIRLAVRDGRGPQRPPVSHVDDTRLWGRAAH
jgi:hypothetical protein